MSFSNIFPFISWLIDKEKEGVQNSQKNPQK